MCKPIISDIQEGLLMMEGFLCLFLCASSESKPGYAPASVQVIHIQAYNNHSLNWFWHLTQHLPLSVAPHVHSPFPACESWASWGFSEHTLPLAVDADVDSNWTALLEDGVEDASLRFPRSALALMQPGVGFEKAGLTMMALLLMGGLELRGAWETGFTSVGPDACSWSCRARSDTKRTREEDQCWQPNHMQWKYCHAQLNYGINDSLNYSYPMTALCVPKHTHRHGYDQWLGVCGCEGRKL